MDHDRAAFEGEIADLPVIALLQTLAKTRQTGVAKFDTPSGTASVWFRDGDIIDADMGSFRVENAVRRLITIEEGTFQVELKPIQRDTAVRESTAALLGLRPLSGQTPPPTGPRSRVRRASPGWFPTGGGPGAAREDSHVGPLPTAARPAAGETAPVSPPPSRPSPIVAGSVRPTKPATAGPRRSKSTVWGLPAPARPSASTHRPPDPAPPLPAPSGRGLPNFSPPSTRNDPTLTGYSSLQTLGQGADGSGVFTPPPSPSTSPRQHDASGPIDVGMTWRAPAHLSGSTRPQPKHSIESDDQSSVGGTIAPRRASSSSGNLRILATPSASGDAAANTPDRGPPAHTPPPPAPGILLGDGPPPPASSPAPAIFPDGGSPASTTWSSDAVSSPSPRPGSGEHRSAPAVVGRYEVLLRIARGGMGTVYLCRVTGEGGFRRLFALKVIRDHLSRNEEYVRMLLQEAKVASRLLHPNVVGIVDIGVLSGQHYLVMDYVEGCTFSELLKVHKRNRPPELIVPIVLDALTGLHEAHTQTDDDGSPLTLVHCDFSPQNMLVGVNGICRISDFGISRAADALHETTGVTRGKPGYLAPEQVRGQPLDHRADIFAAGVILWNALTGEQLFGGETPEDTLDQVLTKPIPPPSTVGLRPPSCFDAVCLRALQRDPAGRYQSAQEMLIELRRIAMAEDMLAPSADIARWVSGTFGVQLERRRQAAGVAGRGNADEPLQARHVPGSELGVIGRDEESVTHAVPVGDDHGPDDPGGSRTLMLRPSMGGSPLEAEGPDLSQNTRHILLAAAVAACTFLVVAASFRPEWFVGGSMGEFGQYESRPVFDPAPPELADPPTTAAARVAGVAPTPAVGGTPAIPPATRPPADPSAQPPASEPTSPTPPSDSTGATTSPEEAAAPPAEHRPGTSGTSSNARDADPTAARRPSTAPPKPTPEPASGPQTPPSDEVPSAATPSTPPPGSDAAADALPSLSDDLTQPPAAVDVRSPPPPRGVRIPPSDAHPSTGEKASPGPADEPKPGPQDSQTPPSTTTDPGSPAATDSDPEAPKDPPPRTPGALLPLR